METLKPKTLAEALAALDTQTQLVAKLNGDLTAAQSLFTDADTARAAAESRAITAETSLTEVSGKLTTETARADGLQKNVDTLTASAKSAEQRAAEICAAAGVKPIETAPGSEAGEGSLTEQYNAIKDPVAKGEFLLKYKAALYTESKSKKKG